MKKYLLNYGEIIQGNKFIKNGTVYYRSDKYRRSINRKFVTFNLKTKWNLTTRFDEAYDEVMKPGLEGMTDGEFISLCRQAAANNHIVLGSKTFGEIWELYDKRQETNLSLTTVISNRNRFNHLLPKLRYMDIKAITPYQDKGILDEIQK